MCCCCSCSRLARGAVVAHTRRYRNGFPLRRYAANKRQKVEPLFGAENYFRMSGLFCHWRRGVAGLGLGLLDRPAGLTESQVQQEAVALERWPTVRRRGPVGLAWRAGLGGALHVVEAAPIAAAASTDKSPPAGLTQAGQAAQATEPRRNKGL